MKHNCCPLVKVTRAIQVADKPPFGVEWEGHDFSRPDKSGARMNCALAPAVPIRSLP